MQKWIKKHGVTLLLVLIMLAGAGFISYPTFSDWWNSFHQSRAVADYVETVNHMDPEENARLLAEAEEYNRGLLELDNQWAMSEERKRVYDSLLSVEGSDIMGYVSIDKIGVRLPIHHGTEESVLQVAIGHIAETSLPTGGPGTHTVISGHRGLPSARLFTDIDKLVAGDYFTLSVLGREMTYEVDQIVTVLPTELEELKIVPEEDYCTLVTCTPYGINTHRLLVRGRRTANPAKQKTGETESAAGWMNERWKLPIPIFVAAPAATVLLLILIFIIRALTAFVRKKQGGNRYTEKKQEDSKNDE